MPLVYLLLVVFVSHVVVDAATCDGTDVTEPLSLRDPTGWDSQDLGAGKRRQGHISAEITAWGQEHIVVFGGTSLRTDGVNDVFAEESSVAILDISNPQNWTELEMVGESARQQHLSNLPWFPIGNCLLAASRWCCGLRYFQQGHGLESHRAASYII